MRLDPLVRPDQRDQRDLVVLQDPLAPTETMEEQDQLAQPDRLVLLGRLLVLERLLLQLDLMGLQQAVRLQRKSLHLASPQAQLVRPDQRVQPVQQDLLEQTQRLLALQDLLVLQVEQVLRDQLDLPDLRDQLDQQVQWGRKG